MFSRPRIIPCLLLEDGNLVKTKRFNDSTYLGDPINAIRIFNEEEADELCVLDISARKRGAINFSLLKDIVSEAFIPLSYGGFIQTVEDAKTLFRMGFEKVVFNTALTTNADVVRETVKFVGKQSVIASIDIKKNFWGKYHCYAEGGKKEIDLNYLKYLSYVEELGVGEVFINSIDNDGMMCGYDLQLIKKITENTSLPVIACGGAGKISDLALAVKNAGAHAVAAGSLFVFWGPRRAVLINYPQEDELRKVGLI